MPNPPAIGGANGRQHVGKPIKSRRFPWSFEQGISYLKFQHEIFAKEIHAREDKGTRFSRATLYFEKGQVLFPRDAPWLADLERELLQFPNVAHDDQVDSVSQYLNWSQERSQNTFEAHWLNEGDPTVDEIAEMLL